MIWNGELLVSVAVLLAGLGLSSWMYWLEKHPRKDFRPRLFPTTLFLLLGGLVALGAGIHLLALAGLQLPAKAP